MAHNQQQSSTTVEQVRGPWSPEEDVRLRCKVEEEGPYNWSQIASFIPGRTAESCHLRWYNQLSLALVHIPFSQQEDEIIVNAHQQHGNKWATIARLLVGRSDNAVKNCWNGTLKQKLLHGGLHWRNEFLNRNPAMVAQPVALHEYNTIPNGNTLMAEPPITLRGYNLDLNANFAMAAPSLTFQGHNFFQNGNDAMVVSPMTLHGLNVVPDWNAVMATLPLTNEQMYPLMTPNTRRLMQSGTVSTELSLFATGVEREMGEAMVAMARAEPVPTDGNDLP